MECLIIGGTGTISEGIAYEAIRKGHSVTIINRGNSNDRAPEGVIVLQGDINNHELMNSVFKDKIYDVIVDPVTYNVEQLKQRIAFFQSHSKLYVFISSAAAMGNHKEKIDEKTEKTPKWHYGENKLKCEEYLESLKASELKYLIIRPSITYGDIRIPIPVACRINPWTIIDRISNDKPLVCFRYRNKHTTFHHLMNVRDFSEYVVELFEKDKANNNDYIVCSDNTYSWDEAYKALYKTLGKDEHVYEVDRDVFKFMNPELYLDIIYDKDSDGAIFSNAKVKKDTGISVDECMLDEGIEMIVDYLGKNYSSKAIEQDYNEMTDAILLCGIQSKDLFLLDYVNKLDRTYKIKLRLLWFKRRLKYAIKSILR